MAASALANIAVASANIAHVTIATATVSLLN
jgi:hypothetical protein